MNDHNAHKTEIINNGELDVIKLISVLWSKKLIIFLITLISAVSSIIYSLSIENSYTSSALLIPAEPQDQLSSKINNFSALSSYSGISLPNTTITKSQEGIERIKSYNFFSKIFLPNIDFQNLVAVERWSPNENKIYYNDKIFNEDLNSFNSENKITLQEAYVIYRNILTIYEDKKTSFITISINHHSPYIAKEWADIIIYEINESMRQYENNIAKKSISYLSEAQQNTTIQPLRDSISELLETQMRTLMLAHSNENYVFKIIDSPIVPEKKSFPNRALICIVGTLFGGIISILIALAAFYREKSRRNI